MAREMRGMHARLDEESGWMHMLIKSQWRGIAAARNLGSLGLNTGPLLADMVGLTCLGSRHVFQHARQGC